MTVLREYHAALGVLIHEFEGTLERFVGDGVLVLFNDPIPVPRIRAFGRQEWLRAMRARLAELAVRWRASRPYARLRRRHRPRIRDARDDRLRGAQ